MAGEPKQFVLFKDAKGEWRWTLYAVNARKIADSAEGYLNKNDCIRGIKLVAAMATDAGIWNGVEQRWE
ncbi:MAG TPA: DUF1508 domain-containing protein [Steroidobacteraceae bacterium]|nr:DUF1508 domain-containing protein [Steroidobacteraceae bacterium]